MRALALTQNRILSAAILILLLVPFALNMVRKPLARIQRYADVGFQTQFGFGLTGYSVPTFGCYYEGLQPSVIIYKRHVRFVYSPALRY